jgi:hypothetical protein
MFHSVRAAISAYQKQQMGQRYAAESFSGTIPDEKIRRAVPFAG